MSLFDRLVDQALRATPDLATVRAVVEKELLHHDILREMSTAGLLTGLTFIGGTCLRACYGSPRLSEDLDFTGGQDFSREALHALAAILIHRLEKKYSLKVLVLEPVKESQWVDTWKMTVVTHPDRPDLPPQRIHIDICAVPSHDRRPMMLRNLYGVDMGTSGLILQAQSREEILTDKIVALALRPNRMKNRDLWDIVWLKQQGVELPVSLVPVKVLDHHRDLDEFRTCLASRVTSLESDPAVRSAFLDEMRRFLPPRVVAETVTRDDFWTFLSALIRDESRKAGG